MMRAQSVRTRASIILDAGETRESVDRTVDLMLELRPNEIKPHFLALRPHAGGSGQAAWAKQGIFEPICQVRKDISDHAGRRLRDMVGSLSELGYAVLEREDRSAAAFWEDLTLRCRDGTAVDFVSLPIAPYGLGW